MGVNHTLTNLDKENLRADCVLCGPVKVSKRYRRRAKENRADRYDYRCQERNRIARLRKHARESGAPLTASSEELYSWYRKRTGIDTKCEICERELGGKGFLDHDHATGVIRGVLCRECNTAIGMFSDNVNHLIRAINYLSKW